MKRTFTLKNIVTANQESEKKQEGMSGEGRLKKETLSNILNFSKALSVRKSETIENIEMILN